MRGRGYNVFYLRKLSDLSPLAAAAKFNVYFWEKPDIDIDSMPYFISRSHLNKSSGCKESTFDLGSDNVIIRQ
jgi:hypothetical protein